MGPVVLVRCTGKTEETLKLQFVSVVRNGGEAEVKYEITNLQRGQHSRRYAVIDENSKERAGGGTL